MKVILSLAAVCLLVWAATAENPHGAQMDDNDFAEFEDFDDEDATIQEPPEGAPKQSEEPKKVLMAAEASEQEVEMADDDDATVEDDEDEDEFEHFQDEDEFEGFDKDHSPVKGKGQERPPDLKIAKVPLHLRTSWESYYMEVLMLSGIAVYFLNFIAGKSKNHKLAQAWLSSHKELLESNFSIVGDDGTSTEAQSGVLMKESENVYSLWCSGRTCVEGMLVTLKLLKRQDLVSTISRMFKPCSDQISVKVIMDENEMDTFIMCLANKKVLGRLQKDMTDLSWYCPEKKNVDKLKLPPSFLLLSEIGEATQSILDSKVCQALERFETEVEYMHFSDQYSGLKQQDDSTTPKMPETQKVLMFNFNVPGQGSCSPADMAKLRPLLQMVFHCIEKVKKIRLSREAKLKADKNRAKVLESLQKATHQQRSEAAQQRKEDKKRAEKERIMSEDDPDRQRKLEERNTKKEMKKKQSKVKMMKVKM